MADQIDDYVKRPMRYQNIDGLDELLIGVLLTGVGLLQLFREIAPSGSIWKHNATFEVCAAAVFFIVVYDRKALKKRVTYLRTGYVKCRHTRKGVWRIVAGALMAIAVAFATFFVLYRFALPSSKLVVIAWTSALWGLIYAMLTWMDAAWRWVVLVALIVAPPVVAMLPLGHLWSDYLPYLLQGLIFFVSGAVTLTLYLRRNPVLEQGVE